MVRTLVMGVSTGLLLWSRFRLMGTGPPQFQAVDNPASYAESTLTRVSAHCQSCKASLLLLTCLMHGAPCSTCTVSQTLKLSVEEYISVNCCGWLHSISETFTNPVIILICRC